MYEALSSMLYTENIINEVVIIISPFINKEAKVLES